MGLFLKHPLLVCRALTSAADAGCINIDVRQFALCFRHLTLFCSFRGCPSTALIHSFIHPDKSCYHNVLNREYSLAPTDDLIRFWRSKVKVTAVCRGQILEHHIP